LGVHFFADALTLRVELSSHERVTLNLLKKPIAFPAFASWPWVSAQMLPTPMGLKNSLASLCVLRVLCGEIQVLADC
jgi:hypothetical protein